MHCYAPSYLSGVSQLVPDAVTVFARLVETGIRTCVIPWTRPRLGDRAFDVAAVEKFAKASLRSTDSLVQFRRQLKTQLFVH